MLVLSIYSCAVFQGVRTFTALLWTVQACYRSIYLVLRTWDACKEDEGGDEEADAEVQVDGGSRAFDGADQREGQDADEQAN